MKVLALSQGDAQRGNKFRFSEAGAREVHYRLRGRGLEEMGESYIKTIE